MSERTRDDSGRFQEEVTEEDILKIFEEADEPFLTAKEIAKELPITREGVLKRLEKMRDKNLVGKKKTGARAVAWWAKVTPSSRSEIKDQTIDPDDEFWELSGFASGDESIDESDIDEILYGEIKG
ncbi:MAG: HTH domain-containing protein [Halobacteria archaeon]|nr:HTH domain-containing protein [Halobacteria archaeon]